MPYTPSLQANDPFSLHLYPLWIEPIKHGRASRLHIRPFNLKFALGLLSLRFKLPSRCAIRILKDHVKTLENDF